MLSFISPSPPHGGHSCIYSSASAVGLGAADELYTCGLPQRMDVRVGLGIENEVK